MGYRRYIKVSEEGRVLKSRVTSGKMSDPWKNVTGEAGDLLGKGFEKVLWHNGKLIEKEEIKLEVGSKFFPADGQTEVAIGIRGPTLDDDEEVKIAINDDTYTITKNNDILLSSEEPGMYIVSIDDIKYTGRPSTVTIVAQTVLDEEE